MSDPFRVSVIELPPGISPKVSLVRGVNCTDYRMNADEARVLARQLIDAADEMQHRVTDCHSKPWPTNQEDTDERREGSGVEETPDA